MTRRLILIRHAKAADPEGVEDHGRPLSDRGRDAAAEIGRWMAENRLLPDEIVVSDAMRTRQQIGRAHV